MAGFRTWSGALLVTTACLLGACSGAEEASVARSAGDVDAGSAPPAAGMDAGATATGDAGGSCGNGVVEGDELCDGGSAVACSALGAVWGAGQATCRKDCSGYDVSACTRSAQASETIYPGKRDARWANAKCNDGTPFAFEVSLAAKPTNKWILSFEGGGSCDGTYQSCASRPAGLLSSAKLAADRAPADVQTPTLFSRDPAVNPDFFDANFVKGQYCSSDLWSGTNLVPKPMKMKSGTTVPFVFTGRHNARALIGELFRAYGLDDATSEVLFTGNSAGAAGAFTNIDLVASRMPKAIAERRLALLVSAAWVNGLWTDMAFSWGGKGKPDAEVIADLGATYAAEPNVRCAAKAKAEGRSPATCIVGAFAYDAAAKPAPEGWGVRTMIAQNRLDQLELKDHLIPTADTTDPAALQARATWLAQMTTSLQPVAWLYAPADPQTSEAEENLHGIVPELLVWNFEPPGHPGQRLRDVLGRFWKARTDGPGERVVFEGPVPHEGGAEQ